MLESLCRELNVCLAYRISGSNTGVLKHSNDFVSIEYLIYRIASSNIGVIQQIIELVFSIYNQWFQYQQSVCMNYRLQSQNPVFCFQNEWFQYRSPEAQNQYFKFDFTFLLDFFFQTYHNNHKFLSPVVDLFHKLWQIRKGVFVVGEIKLFVHVVNVSPLSVLQKYKNNYTTPIFYCD